LTWYDFQKNGSMGRMISATTAALGGYRHISWMWTAGEYPGVQRRVYARSKPEAGVWSTAQEVGLGTVASGYCNQTHLNDGNPVVIFHRWGIGGNVSYLARADAPAANPLYTRKWDLPDDLPEGASGEVGAWPKGDVLFVEDTVYAGGPWNYLHIIETESALEAGAQQFIGYMRCYVDPGDINNLKCQTPTISPEVYNIPANTAFQDEVYGFDESCDLSAVIVTNRFNGSTGARVTMAYMPIINDDCDQMHNVGYYECMDNGDGWLDGTDWPATLHMVADYTGANERAYHDVSACYDYDDSLHIVWTTAGFDPANPGFFQPGVARIYHWSKEHGVSMIASKIQEGANPSAHCINASKVSISPKDPALHGDSTYLFCIWAQVDSSDQNAAGDQGNADIFGSGSFDGGNTWGKVLNLTGTKTPGCAADACVSDHNPSLALNMRGGDLHVEYICDRDAGWPLYDEGAWTENYVMYMRLPEWEVTAGPRGEYKIVDPAHWYHPPIKVLPNQTRSITFKLFSIGNEALTYSVSSDHPCIQVNVPPTQLQPKDSIEIPVLLDGTGACNGTFIAGNVILTTDEAGGKVENLRAHAVVADDYYECPRDPETFDTLENDYLRLYVNANCQQWAHDIGWDVDTTHEVFFQGGTFVAVTDDPGDTLVGRYMGDNDMRAGAQDKLYSEQCEPDWEPHFWVLFTKEIYIEASHLPPPAHFKWWWWEVAKQVKFFKPGAPEEYQRIVIKYVKVKRQDPPVWWPDLSPFVGYNDTYIGFAMDVDAPFDSSGGGEPFVGDENACNVPGYDPVKHIAYVSGFGRPTEHPEYNNYYAGIALAKGAPDEDTVPHGVNNVKNNYYLYPQSPWGWKDEELYRLAASPGDSTQDPDSIVDRTIVITARKIEAGNDPNMKASFTIVEVLAPNGLVQMEALVDTARAIVHRERAQGGLPAACGDVQGDFVVNVGDVVYLVTYLYKGGPAPYCPTARGDVNNDGVINVGDVVYLVTYLYKGGPPPNCPGIWPW
ncbi:MAG: dockerin type I repeat-containing protein, partial [Candidatus Zixiibacteriota bacterium]